MFQLSGKLVAKIIAVDKQLKGKYSNYSFSKRKMRDLLEKSFAKFRQMKKLNRQTLANFLSGKEIGAVDGSVNQTKGEPPFVLYFFQALAKTAGQVECWEHDIFSPLLKDELESDEPQLAVKKKIQSELELIVAKRLIETANVKLLLMDGSLTHFEIDAQQEWNDLKRLALEKEVLLVGVTEEVGTKNLCKLSAFNEYGEELYDRDLLYGILEEGEMLYVEDAQLKKNVQTAWLRSSTSPAIIGIDVLNEQKQSMEEIADVVFTLTPKEGRGIPIILDMIDSEVRVTDKLVEALVEEYIDPALKRRLFTPKRTERMY
ncbi:MAG TPA: DNA double-strand break repair nuclease NurA [Bacilli bacterium]|nr:DNA double-strand break repair nuclease NurA [Bacilli bacterium]